MGEFDLVIEARTAAKKQSFLNEFNRSTQLHGESYEVSEKDGIFNLKLKPGAPVDGGIPCVYMDVCDWRTLWKEPPSQPSTQMPGNQFGIYQSPEGELWIDGSWENAYGSFQKGDRNDRVKKAELAYSTAKIHASPHRVLGWKQIG